MGQDLSEFNEMVKNGPIYRALAPIAKNWISCLALGRRAVSYEFVMGGVNIGYKWHILSRSHHILSSRSHMHT